MPTLQRTRGSGSSEGHGVVDGDGLEDPFVQNIFVLRHGEVVSGDGEEEEQGSGTSDPPLSEHGKVQAWHAGRLLRQDEWNITRVVVSPLLPCVQTAAEVLAGLCLRPCSVQQEAAVTVAAPSSSPPSSIKVSIECGFAEMVKKPLLDLAVLYSLLPQEFHDASLHANKQMVSSYKEGEANAYFQFIPTLQRIANKFHTENILCITHGERVIESASMMWPHVEIYKVEYCAYTHAQRPNFRRGQRSNFNETIESNTNETILSGEWELLTESGSGSGIFFHPICR